MYLHHRPCNTDSLLCLVNKKPPNIPFLSGGYSWNATWICHRISIEKYRLLDDARWKSIDFSRVVDGEDLDGVPMTPKAPVRAAMFVPSKWETVDDSEEVTSKWEEDDEGLTNSRLGEESSERIMQDSGPEDIDGVSLDGR